jgi:hypothetical protein
VDRNWSIPKKYNEKWESLAIKSDDETDNEIESC